MGNGGCHPLATCVEQTGLVRCFCPPGLGGLGVGPAGCLPGLAPALPGPVAPGTGGPQVILIWLPLSRDQYYQKAMDISSFVLLCSPGEQGLFVPKGPRVLTPLGTRVQTFLDSDKKVRALMCVCSCQGVFLWLLKNSKSNV